MKYFVTLEGRTYEVDLAGDRPTVDGEPFDAELTTLPGTPLRNLVTNGRSRTIAGTRDDRRGDWEITVGGERTAVRVVDERTQAILELTGGEAEILDRTIEAPMPGLVVRILVEEGTPVKAGQGMVVVEAMKMENELKAAADGVVASVEVEPGQAVEKGQTLVVLEPGEQEDRR